MPWVPAKVPVDPEQFAAAEQEIPSALTDWPVELETVVASMPSPVCAEAKQFTTLRPLIPGPLPRATPLQFETVMPWMLGCAVVVKHSALQSSMTSAEIAAIVHEVTAQP